MPRYAGMIVRGERLSLYSKYVYEAGAVAQADSPGAKIINKKIIVNERKKK